MPLDPRCVYLTFDPGLADVVASWLSGNGLSAKAVNCANASQVLGQTPISASGPTDPGIEVWVDQPEQAEEARVMLAEHEEFHRQNVQQGEAEGNVVATCEECGHMMTFPGELRGSVQTCSVCKAYLDVPETSNVASATAEDWMPEPEAPDSDIV